ncbi:MAG: cupredoxin domain-containing protein [Nanoarchaeota archaeon]|nr:cupredoxin domain-containing protein [Nanoarchaeota archaeon]
MVRKKTKYSYSISLLIALVVILIVLLILSLQYNTQDQEVIVPAVSEKKYTIEEVIEPETEEIAEETPLEESHIEEEIEVLNEYAILIQNLKFNPNEITVPVGTTITWINKDTSPHKVVAFDRTFYGPRMAPGGEYTFTFTEVGTYTYFDANFPKVGRGKIIVMKEPLPIIGNIIAVDQVTSPNSAFALVVVLFAVMVFALSYGMHNHYKK